MELSPEELEGLKERRYRETFKLAVKLREGLRGSRGGALRMF